MTRFSLRAISPVLAVSLLTIAIAGCGSDPSTAPSSASAVGDPGMAGISPQAGSEDAADPGATLELPTGRIVDRTPAPAGVQASGIEGYVALSWRPPVEPYTARIFWNDELVAVLPASDGGFVWAPPKSAGPQRVAVCYQRTGRDGPLTVVMLDLVASPDEGSPTEPAPESFVNG